MRKINYKDILNLRKTASDPKRLIMLLLAVVFAFLLNSFVLDDNIIKGKVVRVIDGDTIELLDFANEKYRIRFFGIDAPESKQDFGNKSKDYLASLIAGKEVQVIKKSKDKYGRIVGIVEFNGQDINKAMVANGYAWAYSYYTDAYVQDQKNAKSSKLGLWKSKNPIEPYEWRKHNRKEKE
ncbi:nuclease [Campylobacter sp. MIT 99-7217]|uniref:thermonuclease family protein n=1 Tax=Campylobacter sp. MIT 99-7217 TaxID=535091 RepID=UPI00115721D9|nr:thermonuclease family protein [Campylobacter sp. MIT 99-7217]TQR34664.1 nuclease [Campylobacter sp. MIT 99-7217]